MATWLVQLLGAEKARVPALQSIGNFAAGSDTHAQSIIECGALPRLRELIEEGNTALARDASFAVSNLLAGTPEQLALTVEAGVIPGLLARLNPALEVGSSRDHSEAKPYWPGTNWAAVALVNVLLHGTVAHAQTMIAAGCGADCA